MSYRRNWEFNIIIMLKNKTHNFAFFFAENSCLSPLKRHSARISQKKADAGSDRLCQTGNAGIESKSDRPGAAYTYRGGKLMFDEIFTVEACQNIIKVIILVLLNMILFHKLFYSRIPTGDRIFYLSVGIQAGNYLRKRNNF